MASSLPIAFSAVAISNWVCRLSQNPGVVPKAFESRSALSAHSAGTANSVIGAVVDTVVAVEERVLAEPLAFDIHTYICGLNEMVSAVRERLTSFGWHKKQIIFERYD